MQTVFFHQIRIRGVTCVGKLWVVLVSCRKCRAWLSVIWIGLSSCLKCDARRFSLPEVPGVDWVGKKSFLIVNLFLHFNQMDARRLPAQRHVLFILISVIVQTTSGYCYLFSTETCGVFICLFIYSFCWRVGVKCISKLEEISVYNTLKVRCVFKHILL